MRHIKFFIPPVLALIILLVLFWRVDMREVHDVFRQSDKWLLAGSLFVILIAHVITALRWKVMLKTAGCEISLGTSLRLFFANLPIAKIVPLYGGEFLRTFYLRDKISVAHHAGVIFAGMALDIFSISALSLVGGLVLGMKSVYVFSFVVLAGLLALFAFFSVIKNRLPLKLRGKVGNFLHIFRILVKRPGDFIEAITLTLAIWFFVFMYIYLTFFALSAQVPFLAVLAIQPVVSLVSLLPITVWGIGTRETVMIFLYSGLAGTSVIFAAGLAYSFVGAVLMPALFLPLTYKTWREITQKSARAKK